MLLLSCIIFISPAFGLLLTILSIGRAGNNIQIQAPLKMALPFALLFAAFGYSLETGGECDLTRYYEQVQEMAGRTFSDVIVHDGASLYTKDVLFYFVSRTENLHILPLIVSFSIYLIVFYVFFDVIRKSSYSFTKKQILAIGMVMTCVIPAYSVINNTRCVFAYVLIGFAVYREIREKKKNILTLLLYVIPVWLHVSAIVVILLRLFQYVFKRLRIGSLIIAMIFPIMIDIAHTYAKYYEIGAIGKLLVTAVNKAYYYLHWTTGGWADEVGSSLTNLLNRTYGTFFIITLILLIMWPKLNQGSVKIKRSFQCNKVLNEPMVGFLIGAGICALGCLSIRTGAFWRFEAIVVLFSPVILVPLIENREPIVQIGIKGIFLSAFLLSLIYIIWYFRNIDVWETVKNYVSVTGFKVSYELMKGLIGQ